jgi:hypothetical protein
MLGSTPIYFKMDLSIIFLKHHFAPTKAKARAVNIGGLTADTVMNNE